MSDKNPLLGLRDKIDALDLQIMQAISDRAKCAQQVAEVKKEQGDKAYYKPEREAQVLRHIMETNVRPPGQ